MTNIKEKFETDFASTANIDQTREHCRNRLGETIAGLFGEDDVKALFESHGGKHPDEYEGKPTGLIALDLGVIDAETKDALLIAQAAERIYTIAERTEDLWHRSGEIMKEGSRVDDAGIYQFDEEALGHVHLDDPVFSHVGAAGDPPALQSAQGTWLLSQFHLNHEINVIRYRIMGGAAYGEPRATSLAANAFTSGFKAQAAHFYGQAAEIIADRADSFADAEKKRLYQNVAGKFHATAKALAPEQMPAAHQMPDECARTLDSFYRPPVLEALGKANDAMQGNLPEDDPPPSPPPSPSNV